MSTRLTWQELLAVEKQQPYFKSILREVAKQRASNVTIYPPAAQVFEAFRLTEFHQIKVVILGQDPYHGPDQAHGLAFSVLPTLAPPPSLQNIYKELTADINGFIPPKHGHLASWAQQGVLLLNSVLTVQRGQAHSHARLGWEIFTDKVISLINQHHRDVIFLLWGAHAQKKGQFIDTTRHSKLSAPHPSPLSAHRGFLGCGHFSKTNAELIKRGLDPINWQPSLPKHAEELD